jgi:hypothetical protein
MKPLPSAPTGALVAVAALMASGPVWSQFTTLDEYGNAAGTGSFTQNAGTIAITGGGADFWGNSDAGVFLWNDTGSQTTTGDFTATVRHVSTTTPAPEWGRDGIIVRATQTPGLPSPNDAHWLVHRKSNGQFLTGRRPTAGAGTYRATDIGNAAVNFSSDDNEQSFQTGSVTTTPYFLAAGREGDRLFSGYALDLGGVPGRWIQHWSTDNPDAIGGLQGGAEVVVGLAHQSHPQTIVPDENDINTATFDNWTYAGTFDLTKFGAATGAATWQIAGTVAGNPTTGEVRGSAYVTENGTATGDNVKWTVSVYPLSSFQVTPGSGAARKDPTTMEVDDLVPPANFRHIVAGNPVPGLKADIYMQTNAGNLAAFNTIVTGNPPDGSTVIPNIHWSNNPTPPYPDNGMGGNLFADAVAGSFVGNQENYGVNMTGQIFIPGDGDRSQPNLPGEFIVFKDGVDDFCYLEIDGKALINDNDWTGNESNQNGGGNISALDVSDSKFNDGEWVDFRMVMWEGGGGDTASLYWSALDTNGTFTVEMVPGAFGSFVPTPGVAFSRKDPTGMEVADLVPAADFRYDDGTGFKPGLKADIYLGGNQGNFAALDGVVQNTSPAGTAILPRVHWSHPDAGVGYPPNGAGGDLFSDAVPSFDAAGDGQEDYGVNMTGEIFIPALADRTALPVPGGNKLVLFEDGVDDFCYLEIDGQVLINDNDWTGNTSTDNGGGNVSLMDVSNTKFDDGEWVSFRMLTWEGGGGDTASLYWSARDINGSFGRAQVPGTSEPTYRLTGTDQIGSEATEGRFGTLNLPNGDWLLVLDLANTGTTLRRLSSVTVTGGAVAPAVTSFSYDAATTTLNLSFSSAAGSNYALEYTTGLQPAGAPTSAAKWNVVPGYGSIAGAAGTTAITPLNTSTLVTPAGQLPNNTTSYFRIRRL